MEIVEFTFTLMTRLIKRSAHTGWAVRLYLLPRVRLKKVRLKVVTRIRYRPDKREPRVFPQTREEIEKQEKGSLGSF